MVIDATLHMRKWSSSPGATDFLARCVVKTVDWMRIHTGILHDPDLLHQIFPNNSTWSWRCFPFPPAYMFFQLVHCIACCLSLPSSQFLVRCAYRVMLPTMSPRYQCVLVGESSMLHSVQCCPGMKVLSHPPDYSMSCVLHNGLSVTCQQSLQ